MQKYESETPDMLNLSNFTFSHILEGEIGLRYLNAIYVWILHLRIALIIFSRSIDVSTIGNKSLIPPDNISRTLMKKVSLKRQGCVWNYREKIDFPVKVTQNQK